MEKGETRLSVFRYLLDFSDINKLELKNLKNPQQFYQSISNK
jgi:hypothetical protein